MSTQKLVEILNMRMAQLAQSLRQGLTYPQAVELTADTTLDASHSGLRLRVDASGGAVALTLPPVASSSGLEFHVKKVDSSLNAVTFVGTVDGDASFGLGSQYEAVRVSCDGTEYGIW